MSTVWIAQNRTDPTWLFVFESRPTDEDLWRVGRGCDMGPRSDWSIFGAHIHATAAGTAKRRERNARLRAGYGEGL